MLHWMKSNRKKMLNKVTLIGNAGSEPSMHTFDNGDKITNLTLATSVKWKTKEGEQKEKTTWHNLVFSRGLADVVSKYVTKGSKLYIEGSIDNYSYTNKEGATTYATRINVSEMKMLSTKDQSSATPAPVATHPQPTIPPIGQPTHNVNDDDLPF